MARKNRTSTDIVDCACVIHSTGYDWIYVERLYNMLSRNLPQGIRFHVYTEAERPIPGHMIKHSLTPWPDVAGPKKSWWYKLQLFDSKHHSGDLLYFDLDTVIVNDISWITALPTEKLWTIKDFKRLQHESWSRMNSSVMWWNVPTFDWVWQQFSQANLQDIIRQYRDGDQQYIMETLTHNNVRFFNEQRIQSWRWQAFDGGMSFPSKQFLKPGTGTHIENDVSVLVFHGHPKPHEITDPTVVKLWV